MLKFVGAPARCDPPGADQQKGVDVSKVSGIYRIELGNGWFYIGSSVNLKDRKNKHKSTLLRLRHDNQRMQNCWNKYKIFEFTILENCVKHKLLEREQAYLDIYFNDEKNVNIASVAGHPMLGRKHSAEARKNMSNSQKGKTLSAEHCANMSAAHKGKPLSPEHSAKVVAANRNRVYTDDIRLKMSMSRKGRIPSKETCAKLSIALKGKSKSAEHRANLSKAMKKLPPKSDEYRFKMSMATKGKPKSAETRKKMSDAWVLRRAKLNRQ